MTSSLAVTLDQEIKPLAGDRTLLVNARSGIEAKFLADRLSSGKAKTILHIARDASRISVLADLIRFFATDVEIITLPAWDCLPYDRTSPSRAVMAQRLTALYQIVSGSAKSRRIILVSANAVIQRVPPADALIDSYYPIKSGMRVNRDELIAYLESNGYNRVSTVVDPGDYAVRGGLLDVFPIGAEKPARLDFFGPVVESIRSFDPTTQRTITKLKSLDLRPLSEVLLDDAAGRRFRGNYLREFGAVGEDPLLEAVQNGRTFSGMEHWLPMFHESLWTIFEYLEGDWELSFDHLAQDAISTRLELIGEHYHARKTPELASSSFGAGSNRTIPPDRLYLDEQSFARAVAEKKAWQFSIFAEPPALPAGICAMTDLNGVASRDFAPERANRSINLFDSIVTHIKELIEAGDAPIIAAFSKGAAERLSQVLVDHGLDQPIFIKAFSERPDHAASITLLPMDQGFAAPGLMILGEQDLLGERMTRQASRSRRADKFIQDLETLSLNDLVVHAEHGIGRFEGLIAVDVNGAPHDCLKLIYQGGDKLFVPVENLEILSRYGSSDKDNQLDKLGGVGWQQRKAKVKKRIRELADELIKIAAQRALRKGRAIELPDGMYDEFAARFPYEETEDQLRAIESVLADMSSGQPMDRLICGDVGFGKTEVAIRAAFVSAMAGKQVALLAPTTLLARQHFGLFSSRFSGLPIRVEQISRFVPTSKANAVKKDLIAGKVDIVIGTHALLAKTVSFQDLGLVIIDEEQHFGVTHKERLKQLRAEVHVLTMTATPIPRTLHMALGGMKDLSIIATPPVDRLAVRSFVLPVDPVVLREAILREHHRGGQTFFVCPRISDQARLSKDLQTLVPEVKFAVANGQMPAAELEAIMSGFYDQKIDVLISTNIIESGLDIPTANTMIVHRADLFGLSQLYQLRGRIGRSKVRGYAYFTVPSDKTLRAAAEKRLQVIQSLDGLGAGFQLASHDLDMRGAGNLLGDEQSGQIKEVGFELYNSMLEEAVNALRGEEEEIQAAREWTPQIAVDAPALMPESYIADLDLRLAMYRRLAKLENSDEVEGFAAEMIDRFGPVPDETENLLKLVAIKQLCRSANVEKLDLGPKGVTIAFHNNAFPKPERLIQHIADSKGRMRVRPDHRVVVLRDTKSPEERLKIAKTIVNDLARIAA